MNPKVNPIGWYRISESAKSRKLNFESDGWCIFMAWYESSARCQQNEKLKFMIL